MIYYIYYPYYKQYILSMTLAPNSPTNLQHLKPTVIGPHQPLGHQAVLKADHHHLDAIHFVPKVQMICPNFLKNPLMMMIDEPLQGEQKVPRLIKIWQGNPRPEVDKPKAESILIEDKVDNSKVREGGADHLLLERERTSALNREHHSGERRHLLLVRGCGGMEGQGNVQGIHSNQD